MHFNLLRDFIRYVIELYYDEDICHDDCSLPDYIAQALIASDIVKE